MGGEFEIDPLSLIGYDTYSPDPEQYMFSSGRSALRAILKYLKDIKSSTIYIPYYICKSVVTTCVNMEYKVEFYELADNYTFPIDLLNKIEKNSSILLVNYFGFVDLEPTIKTFKENRADVITICDNVQSFWTYDKTSADFSFTSLRKHFGTPDGALLFTNYQHFTYKTNSKINSFYYSKLIGSLLKNEDVDDNLYLHFFIEGERVLDEDGEITKSSKLAQFCFSTTNFEKIKRKRQENTKLIYEFGNAHGLNFMFEYSEDIIPLSVPIQVKERNRVRERLFNNNIYLPIHWPTEKFNNTSEKTVKISNSQLSLIVDHRYSENEMIFQMEALLNCNNSF